LIKFHKWLKLLNNLHYHKSTIKNEQDRIDLRIEGRKIVHFLKSIGVKSQNKSLNQGPIKIPDEYFCDFLRGFIDGDGNITNTKDHQRFLIGFCGTKKLVTFLVNKLFSLFKIKKGIIRPIGKIYKIAYNKSESLQIKNLLYKNKPHFFLTRKKRTVLKYKERLRRWETENAKQ